MFSQANSQEGDEVEEFSQSHSQLHQLHYVRHRKNNQLHQLRKTIDQHIIKLASPKRENWMI
jgi:hypothetical protein